LRPTAQLALSYTYLASPLGQKYTGDTVKLPSVVLALPEAARERLGIYEYADGDAYGPSYLVPLIRYLEGGWGEALGGGLSSNPRNRAKLWNWMTGVNIDPEVPVQENEMFKTMGEFYGEQNEFQDYQSAMRRLQRAFAREAARDATQVEAQP
jgi:hypothetical protein